ncbi:hypothetical protein niasHS_000024 [Heterodera schachtii]|uniref:RING-type domain-containing protein n=1 Tax=Heterodera schachtii TaxID=97005 RepID=A0ABD2KLL6_HETSC
MNCHNEKSKRINHQLKVAPFVRTIISTGKVLLRCHVRHEFHLKCTKIWFKQHKTCPMCHKEIDIPAKNGSESNASNAAEKGKVPSAPNAIPAV